MEKFLKFMSGKKSMISSIIGLVVAYCTAKGYMGENEVILIMGLSSIVFGKLSYETQKMYSKKRLAIKI